MKWFRSLLSLFFILSVLALWSGCSGPAKRAQVVSNASTPVQVLQVRVGRYVDLRLPSPHPSRWWAVESGARPWLQPKIEKDTGRIRLLAVKSGQTEVVCVLRDTQRVIRKVVVAVEVEGAEK